MDQQLFMDGLVVDPNDTIAAEGVFMACGHSVQSQANPIMPYSMRIQYLFQKGRMVEARLQTDVFGLQKRIMRFEP